MAIVLDKKNNKYYINYKITLPNGDRKNVNIKNKTWIASGLNHVTKRYMESIEKKEIEKDKAKRVETYHSGENMNLGELIDLFNRVQKSLKIDDETIYNYNLCYKKYLYQIANAYTQADKVFTISNVDNFRILITSQGFKDRTINNKLVAVKKLVSFAKSRKLISRTMADDAIDLLAPIKETDRSASENNFFHNGEEDLRKFINSFNEVDVEWRVPVLTMFYGALRIGEWQAITREDCDFENCTILINKQIDNHGKLKNKTKTGQDKMIRLPRPFMEELKQYVIDKGINPHEEIFIGVHGGHVSRHAIRNLLERHLELAGLPHLTPHGLRHSFATRMFDKGYDVKEVQMHLGHKSMDTTMKYYIHYTQSKANKDIDDLL